MMSKSIFLNAIKVVILTLFVGFMATPASAASLDDLRMSGAVGEGFDGYARARDMSFKDQVIAINKKRQRIYRERASAQNVSPSDVGKVYAQKIISKAPAGTWLLDSGGNWHQK